MFSLQYYIVMNWTSIKQKQYNIQLNYALYECMYIYAKSLLIYFFPNSIYTNVSYTNKKKWSIYWS